MWCDLVWYMCELQVILVCTMGCEGDMLALVCVVRYSRCGRWRGVVVCI